MAVPGLDLAEGVSGVRHLLRPAAISDADSAKPEGWWIDADAGRLVVRERVNQYGQSPFNWDQVPSTIIDADASSSGHTSLVMSELNKFLTDWKPRSPEPAASSQEEPATPRPRRRRFGFRRRRAN